MAMRHYWKLLLVLLVGCLVSAQTKYADPDSANTNAAARQALGHGKVVDIISVTSAIVGVTSGIQGVLQDLGAKVTDQEVRIDLASDVLFDFDKYTLRPEADEGPVRNRDHHCSDKNRPGSRGQPRYLCGHSPRSAPGCKVSRCAGWSSVHRGWYRPGTDGVFRHRKRRSPAAHSAA